VRKSCKIHKIKGIVCVHNLEESWAELRLCHNFRSLVDDHIENYNNSHMSIKHRFNLRRYRFIASSVIRAGFISNVADVLLLTIKTANFLIATSTS
jgi:hypothetical protein